MAVKSTIYDYSEHPLKDVNICQGAGAGGGLNVTSPEKQPVTFAFGRISSYIAGIQKLVQRYIILLLTQKGSQPIFPSFGTDFMAAIKSKNMVTYEDAIHEFNFANMQVIETFREYQANTPNIPDDEQLNTAVLNSLAYDSASNSAVFNVRIYSNTGENVDYILPIPIQKTI
jgi:hypothetical protein